MKLSRCFLFAQLLATLCHLIKLNYFGAESLTKMTANEKKLKTAFFSNGLLQDENIDHAGKLKSPSSSPHPSQQDILYQNMIRKWTDAHKVRQIFEGRHTEDAVGSNV